MEALRQAGRGGRPLAKEQAKLPESKDMKLTPEEQRVIRDRHYTPRVMLKMWSMIKQRQYEVEDTRQEANEHPKANAHADVDKHEDGSGDDEHGHGKDGEDGHHHGHQDAEAGQNIKTKTMEMPKKEFIEMIRSLFKIMIHGVSRDRLFVLMQEAWNRGTLSLNRKLRRREPAKNSQERKLEEEHNVDFEIYKRLVTETYDASEYRLPLWLPLSLEQKLDMVLHQRIDEEVEMMQFLIDEELGCGQRQEASSLKKYEEVDKMLERALDALVFDKYMTLTRMQAMNASNKMCDERISNHEREDGQLMDYANFLLDKQK